MSSSRPTVWRVAIACVFAAGVLVTLRLVARTPSGVFTNGDLGLKYLAALQWSRGDAGLDLRLPSEPWVETLWNEGFYPFADPFVYTIDGRRYSRFRAAFPVLSAPFLALFGFRGLFVLPLAAAWFLWWSVLRAARAMGLPAGSRFVVTVLLVGSPLTLYAAFFWEHTPALALAFHGLALACLTPLGRPAPARSALAGGVLLGLSAFLREELLVLGGLVVGLAWLPGRIAGHGLRPLRERRAALSAGVLAAWAAFFAVNWAADGHPLGLHARYSLEHFNVEDAQPTQASLRGNLGSLIDYFPVLAASLLLVVPAWTRRRGVPAGRVLALLAAAYSLAVPALLQTTGGKEWGPRFLLAAVPLFALAAGAAVSAAWRTSRAAGVAVTLAVAGLGAGGVHASLVRDPAGILRGYARRAEPLRQAAAHPAHVIVVSHQFVSQQLAVLAEKRRFFRANSARELRRLAKELHRHGAVPFLYVCDSGYDCAPLGPDVERLTFEYPNEGSAVDFVRLEGELRYLFYEARVRPLLPGPARPGG